MFIYLQQVFVCSISELNKLLCIKAIIVKVTVQPFISYIHKPAASCQSLLCSFCLFTQKQSSDGTNKFVPSERAREGFDLISEMKGYSTIKRYLTIQ